MKTKIPIKKYVMNETLSWEERYYQLDKHHKEETLFLIGVVEKLESSLVEWRRCFNVGEAKLIAVWGQSLDALLTAYAEAWGSIGAASAIDEGIFNEKKTN